MVPPSTTALLYIHAHVHVDCGFVIKVCMRCGHVPYIVAYNAAYSGVGRCFDTGEFQEEGGEAGAGW